MQKRRLSHFSALGSQQPVTDGVSWRWRFRGEAVDFFRTGVNGGKKTKQKVASRGRATRGETAVCAVIDSEREGGRERRARTHATAHADAKAP